MHDDASEHLAPVSYLPWAVPGVTGARPDDAEADGADRVGADGADADRASAVGADVDRADADHVDAGVPEREAAVARRPRPSQREDSTRRDGGARVSDFRRGRRSDRDGSPERPGTAASRGAATGAPVDEFSPSGRGDERPSRSFGRGAAHEEGPLETGAERDERIDRLVVSRLRRSALSISEVRVVLVEHGLHELEVDEWIARYERLGYLDDARLAEQLVHVNATRKGKGSGAILQELSRRGIEAEAARNAVEDLDPETEFDNARTTAERRARQLRGLDRQTAERRLSAFLQRRGYGGDVVRQVVTEVLAADGS
ncbi:RecX family transcriptional regulator [Agromyces sp. NPDC058110]|uniref:RecX family transcriptional regulator n=1 Tax=Agromyces sp. NPDC058110 TaxID=3346345 RepID=UPI0036D846FE